MPIPQTQTGKVIGDLVAFYGVRPNQFRGQHFLIDDEVYEVMIRTARLQENETVLEVGAGLGTLTERLGQVAGRVVAVEIEPTFVRILKDRFHVHKKIEIVEGDVRKKSVAMLGVSEPYHVVANIPYYLTGIFFRKFLSQDRQPRSMTVLVQKEVAQRMVAKPGEMSMMALSVQLYATVSVVHFVPAKSFYPPPKVESAVVHCVDIHPFPFTDIEEKFFWRVVRVGFSSPRKQLKNTIQAGFPHSSASDIENIFASASILPNARAQELEIADWHRLAIELNK